MAAVLVIFGAALTVRVAVVGATAGQIMKIVTSDGGGTFYIGRCFRTDFKVQTDSLNANSVDIIVPYNPDYIRPYTGSGCTTAATSIVTDGLFGSYPSNSIASNVINVTGYDPTGSSPVNTGAAPSDSLLGHVYWKVMAASGSYVLRYTFAAGSTTDTNMAQQNGDGTDVLDSVENLTITLSTDGSDPTFSTLNPTNGATGISVTPAISYTFADAGAGIGTGTLTTSLNLTNKSLSFSDCSRSNSNKIASCSVTVGGVGTLSYNTLYRVHATGSDVASPTAHTANQMWTFTTEDDDDAPYIGSLNPASSATNVSVSTNIVLHVKDYKNQAGTTPGLGVDIGTVGVTITPSGGSPVTYTSANATFNYTGTSADYTITINPAADFPENTNIAVSVIADDLHDPANSMTAQNYSFTTVDAGAPSISGRSPDASETGVSTTSNVVFHLTDDGSGVDIDNTTATINGTAYTSADAEFSYSGTGADYTVTINPSSDFTNDSVVTVAVATQDMAGTPNTTTATYGFLVGTDGRSITAAVTTVCTTTETAATNGGNSRRTAGILGSISSEDIPLIIARRRIQGTEAVVMEQLNEEQARNVGVCYVDEIPLHGSAKKTPYTDVLPGSWYEDSLVAFIRKNILDISKTSFRGETFALRSEFAKVLGKLHGDVPESRTSIPSFDDVDPREWYFPFVEFAAEKGWMKGRGNCYGTRPCSALPAETITRAEAAAMVVRFFSLTPTGQAPKFADIPQDAWYAEDIQTAADHCIVRGMGADSRAAGSEPLNRAEMIVLLDRAERDLKYGLDCGYAETQAEEDKNKRAHSSAASTLIITGLLGAASVGRFLLKAETFLLG